MRALVSSSMLFLWTGVAAPHAAPPDTRSPPPPSPGVSDESTSTRATGVEDDARDLLRALGARSVEPTSAARTSWDDFEIEAFLAQDFDMDGRRDLALILLQRGDGEEEPSSRDRVVVMGLRDAAGFHAVQRSGCLSLATDEGGMMGDPGGHMTANGRGGVVFGNDGGSAWRWSLAYTVAWRHAAFRVVGVDTHAFYIHEPGSEEDVSVNLLTGEYLRNRRGPPRTHRHTAPLIGDCGALEALQSRTWP